MPRKKLTNDERKRKDEISKQRFADFWRTKTDYTLRRIAGAYDLYLDYLQSGLENAWEEALKYQGIEGYVPNLKNGRMITSKQGRFVFEMVRRGKYLGVNKEIPRENLAWLPSPRTTNLQNYSGFEDLRTRRYLSDYERSLMDD